MKVLVLNSTLLESLLDLDTLRREMALAMQDLSSGDARSFPRFVATASQGALGFMAAQRKKSLGYKAVSVFPGNAKKGLNPHQGLVVLLDPETGFPQALLDGSTITALRTAAVSAAATDLLAVRDARHLALIGAGRQAYEHARALLRVRPIETIAISSRSLERTEELTRSLSPFFSGEVKISNSPMKAIAQADIVVSATASSSPVFSTSDLKVGCHLNAVGSSRPGACEVAFKSRPGLKVLLDSRAACDAEAEEITSAVKSGALMNSEIRGEIGEALSGKIAGRETDRDVTAFKSVGLGIQDLAAASFFYEQAKVTGLGQFVDV
jgi:alanine dehydrogenase